MPLPIVKATICFLRKNSKTLFLDYRNYDHPLHIGKYSAPGGKLDGSENREEGVIRELFEETGIRVHRVVYRGEVFFDNEKRYFGGKPARNSFRVYYFDSFDFDDSNAKATEGKLAWVSDEDVTNLPMHDGDIHIWEWLRDYKEINARVVHVGNELVEAQLIDSKKS